MKKLTFLLVMLLLFAGSSFAYQPYQVTVNKKRVANGYYTEKIWLTNFELPKVEISGVQYLPSAQPDSLGVLHAGPASGFEITLGRDRKRPFMLISFPAYANNAGSWQALQSLEIGVYEGEALPLPVQKGTAVSSVLAAGTWHKIALQTRGIYRVDYDFLLSHGIISGTIGSDNIRLFGNGGVMLNESNMVARPDDLTENPVEMHDGGDGQFNDGDYFLFYANGTTGWYGNATTQTFTHQKNLYEDSSFYFLTVDNGAGQQIPAQGSIGAPTITVNSYNAYAAEEEDVENPGGFGKVWWGDIMGTLPSQTATRDFTFPLPPMTGNMTVKLHAAVRSSSGGNQLALSFNGSPLATLTFAGVSMSSTDPPVTQQTVSYTPAASGTSAAFHFAFTPSTTDGKAYIDYLEINVRCQLQLMGGQLSFRDYQSVAAGNIAGYELSGADNKTSVWDVTDALHPVKMNGSLGGSTYSFTQDAGALHEFVAFNGDLYYSPSYVGSVVNQDIHGNGPVDLIIVTHPDFKASADELADIHRQQGQSVICVTTDQVYNEFSSGGQDIGGIRDLARWFYKQAGTDTALMPKYLLLFGDASYDYKDRVSGNTNFVPTFESAESISVTGNYCTDDFFGMLDDNENLSSASPANTLDIGVGRLPVASTDQAAAVVNKIRVYISPASLGPWRLSNTYVADNEDGAGNHLSDAEFMEHTVNAETRLYNDNKIYLDQLDFVSTPGGTRCPDANKAINDQIFKGTFLINYNGHGGPLELAHERIVTTDDFNTWNNLSQLAIMMTATCDFSRFDQPALLSSGEAIVKRPEGGAIAMLTTTQQVFASGNRITNSNFLDELYNQKPDGVWNSFGDAFRLSKNVSFSGGGFGNAVCFTLLGDPALQPAFPKYFVATDSIISLGSGQVTDSIKALGGYSVKGSVKDANGVVLNDFTGRLYITIYDKPRNITLVTKATGSTRTYAVQDNIIYKGIASVSNGTFSFSFIAPLDINYTVGEGKISYYAENGLTDAAGSDTSIIVGGSSDVIVDDEDGPVVRAFIDDTTFINGGITGANTLLYADITDLSGINVTGSSVGHDLTAILDGDESNPYILNDYYQTEPNSYQHGTLRFPVTGLSEGTHRLTVKAWDVKNNSGEGSVDFEVIGGNVMAIRDLMNYPNPFNTLTHFVFKHNHPNEALKVKVVIYSSSGQLVRIMEQTINPDGSFTNELTWDGTGNNGEKLPTGLYPYRMIITTPSGVEATAYQKAVLIR